MTSKYFVFSPNQCLIVKIVSFPQFISFRSSPHSLPLGASSSIIGYYAIEKLVSMRYLVFYLSYFTERER